MVEAILILELAVILVAIGIFFVMKKFGYTKVGKKFLVMLFVVFLFEVVSEKLFANVNLSNWAYIYGDVSWAIILLWADILFISITSADRILRRTHERVRFFSYFIISSILRLAIEAALVKTGNRNYSETLTQSFNGFSLPFAEISLGVVVVVIITVIFSITFYKYVSEFLFR